MTSLRRSTSLTRSAELSLALFTRLRDAAAGRRRIRLRGGRSARGPYARAARAAGLIMAASGRAGQSSPGGVR